MVDYQGAGEAPDRWHVRADMPSLATSPSVVYDWFFASRRNGLHPSRVADATRAVLERRNMKELDWWAYHSRRGWEDNDPTGLK